MVVNFTRMDIIQRVSEHFKHEGFDCQIYTDKLGAVRIPLYCHRNKGDSEKEEVIVDVITDDALSRETYLPDMEEQGAIIKDACSTRFFQYYLPHAKIYWAFGHYVVRNKKFDEFKEACAKAGIGLIEVLQDNIKIELSAVSLAETLLEKIRKETAKCSTANELAIKLEDVVDGLHEDSLHYLVYYGAPEFRRRSITSRGTQDLSIKLINQLLSIKHLAYAQELVQLSEKYNTECRQDPEIALGEIQELWRKRLNLEYPNIQKDFESILLLDPWYRDHFLHQFQVFLLGALILDQYYNTSAIRKFKTDNNAEIEDAWLAAATYHDFNYSIQMSEDWMMDFLKQTLNINHTHNGTKLITLDLEGIVVRNEFVRKMQGLCAALSCDMDDVIVRFILERVACDKNHAVLGALTFLNKFQDSTTLSESAVYQCAASIMLHDYQIWQCFCGRAKDGCKQWESALSKKRLIRTLKFQSSPLAFLLAFCDGAQEWGRKGRGHDKSKAELEDIRFDNGKTLIEISFDNDASCDKVRDEIQGLKRFLKDRRFGIILHSKQGIETKIEMTGK